MLSGRDPHNHVFLQSCLAPTLGAPTPSVTLIDTVLLVRSFCLAYPTPSFLAQWSLIYHSGSTKYSMYPLRPLSTPQSLAATALPLPVLLAGNPLRLSQWIPLPCWPRHCGINRFDTCHLKDGKGKHRSWVLPTWYRPRIILALHPGAFLQYTYKLRTSLLQQLSLNT